MKKILTVIGAMLLSTIMTAQVKFNLSYEPVSKVYTVSVLPETSWSSPLNMVSSAQVVLRVQAGMAFTPGITSLVNGLIWADNAYVESPVGAPEYTFVCISLVNGPTNKIQMVADQETPLFSFLNTASDCAGPVTLLPNDDPMVQAVRLGGFNVTQYLPVLGAHGNAFSGLVNNEVDCTPVSGTHETVHFLEEVKILPVPADKAVTVQWTVLLDSPGWYQMVICDAKGVEIMREKTSAEKGAHTLHLNVEHWQAGLYRLRFVGDHERQSKSWNLMVVH